MSKIKYLIITLFILLGTLITGELYQSYAETFSDFYETSFYVQPETDASEMLRDIEKTAERHNVSVFFINEKTENIFLKKISVYSDDTIKKLLTSKYSLKEGSCGSFFSGTTSVSFYSYYDIPNEFLYSAEPKYYLYGNFDDMVSMKEELADKYGGKFPVQIDYSSRSEMASAVFAVWLLIGLLIDFISLYCLSVNQKEFKVRSTMGESPVSLYLKTVLSDSIFMILSFIVILRLMSEKTNVSFMSHIYIPVFCGTVISNCIVNLRVFFFKIREAFSKTAGSSELISGSYIIKVFSCCVSIAVITLQFSTLKEFSELYKQKPFFEKYNNFNYVHLMIKDNNLSADEKFFRTFDGDCLISDPCIEYEDEYGNTAHALLINKAMLNEISCSIPELSGVNISDNGCIIIPENASVSYDDYEYLKAFAVSYSRYSQNDDTDKVRIIKYSSRQPVIAVEQSYKNYSQFVYDPVMIVISEDDFPILTDENIEESDTQLYIRTYNMMINASESEIETFAKENNCEASITNILHYYNYRLTSMKRSLYLSIVFSVLLLILEISINILIIKLEYRFNSVELALKKVFAYSIFERMKRLCLTALILIVISFTISVIVLYSSDMNNIPAAAAVSLLLLTVNFIIILYYTSKYEKANIPKILKGGTI